MTKTEQQTTEPLAHVPQYNNTMTQTEQQTNEPLAHVPQYHDTHRTADN